MYSPDFILCLRSASTTSTRSTMSTGSTSTVHSASGLSDLIDLEDPVDLVDAFLGKNSRLRPLGTKAVSVVPPRLIAPHALVDLAGIEPATSRTPSGRSPPELQARPSTRSAHSGRPERSRTGGAILSRRVTRVDGPTYSTLDLGSWILDARPVVSDIQDPISSIFELNGSRMSSAGDMAPARTSCPGSLSQQTGLLLPIIARLT